MASQALAVSCQEAPLFGPSVSWDFGVDEVEQSKKGANMTGEAVSGGTQARRVGTTDSEESQGLEKGRRTPENLFSLNVEMQAHFFWSKFLKF